MHGTRATCGLIHGHRNAVRRVVCRVLQHMVAVAGAPAASSVRRSLVPCWPCQTTATTAPPSYSRSTCRKFRIYAASWRPIRSTGVWPSARANIEFNWRRAHGGRATAHEKSSGAAQVNAVDINYAERASAGRQVDASLQHPQKRQSSSDSSVRTRSWRHVIAIAACKNIVLRRPDGPFTNIFRPSSRYLQAISSN